MDAQALAEDLLKWYRTQLSGVARKARLTGWFSSVGLTQHAEDLVFLADEATWSSITSDDDPVRAAKEFLFPYTVGGAAAALPESRGDGLTTPAPSTSSGPASSLARPGAGPSAPALQGATPAATPGDQLKNPPVPKNTADAADIVMKLIKTKQLKQDAQGGGQVDWLTWKLPEVNNVLNWWTNTWSSVSAMYKDKDVALTVTRRIGACIPLPAVRGRNGAAQSLPSDMT